MNNVCIGADPELFLKKNGKFHSAYGTIPGTKRKPYPVPGGAVQIDGMAQLWISLKILSLFYII